MRLFKMRVVLNLGKLLLLVLAVWLLALIFMTGPLLKNSESEEALAKKLVLAQSEALSYRRELDQLKASIKEDGQIDTNIVTKLNSEPSKEYENYRRRAFRDIQELWFFARAKLESIKKESGGTLDNKITEVLNELETREQVVLTDLEKLKEADGHDQWRRTEAKDLSDLVQARLKYLQNPEDCSSARKLVCNLNKGCGYGCQVHHAIYCFLVAYGNFYYCYFQDVMLINCW